MLRHRVGLTLLASSSASHSPSSYTRPLTSSATLQNNPAKSALFSPSLFDSFVPQIHKRRQGEGKKKYQSLCHALLERDKQLTTEHSLLGTCGLQPPPVSLSKRAIASPRSPSFGILPHQRIPLAQKFCTLRRSSGSPMHSTLDPTSLSPRTRSLTPCSHAHS